MPALDDPVTQRLKSQLRALQGWIRDLDAENAALRQRLREKEGEGGRGAHRASQAA